MTDANDLSKSFQSLGIPKTHATVGLTNLIASTKQYKSLFIHRRLPDSGWSDVQIQSLLFLFLTLDTNNKTLPANSTRALFRNMTHHDIVLSTAFAKGLWATVPRESMDGKHTEASIFAMIPLFKV